MQVLVELLESIASGFTAVLDFILSTFKGLGEVVFILGKFLVYLPEYFLWLPDSVLAILVVIFSGAVLYKVLGRDG